VEVRHVETLNNMKNLDIYQTRPSFTSNGLISYPVLLKYSNYSSTHRFTSSTSTICVRHKPALPPSSLRTFSS